MPGTDADFAAYVAARWPVLVRTVVLAGCPRSRAEDVVLDGLARCRDGWGRVQRSDDVETHVHRAVLQSWHHHRRHGPLPAEPAPTDELADLEPLLADLEPVQREAIALRAVAGLEPDQVADVLDVGLDEVLRTVPGAPGDDAVRSAAATVEVLPASYDDVEDRARGQRRRRRRVVLASVAAGALVLGAGVWAGAALSREGVRERPVDVERVPNPAAIAWYAAGRLHLREVTAKIPGLVDLVTVGESVVYLDDEGIVGTVSQDGTVLEIGVATRDAGLVGSTDHGWAAWVEPGDPMSRLVVWDVAGRAELGGLQVDPSVHLISIDQGMVQFGLTDADYTWTPPDADPEQLQPRDLIDQASATRVFQHDQRIEIVQPLFGLSFDRPGEGGELSFGGRYVLSREAAGRHEPGAPYRPLLYDTRTGEAVEPGVGRGEEVVDAAFTALQEVAYLVVTDDDGLLLLRTCPLGSGVCQDLAPVPADDGPVLLAE